MSNIIDLLLNADVEAMERPSKVVEIPRLSKMFGSEFKVQCKALSVTKQQDLTQQCVNVTEGTVDISKLTLKTVIEGVYDLEGKWLFKNKDIQKKFKAPTAEELVKKLLLSGEINKLNDILSDLNGFGKGNVIEEKVKN